MKFLLILNLLTLFQQKWYIPYGEGAYGRVLAGDINKNDLSDIVVLRHQIDHFEIRYYEYESGEIFLRDTLDDTTVANFWAWGDFDLDGLNDIVCSAGWEPIYSGIKILESPDSFSYPTYEVWRDTVGPPLVAGIGVYDVDKDGFPEIIKTGGDQTPEGYEDFVVYESIGNNTYLRTFSYVTQASPTSTIGFGDFDGDGANEFVLGEIDGVYSLYESIDDNNYIPVILNQQLPSANCFDVFSVPDADSDGKMEFVVRGYTFPDGKHRVFIFEAIADNTYEIVKTFVFSGAGAYGYSASSSVDGDSIPEMVLMTYPWIRIIKAQGNNNFFVWDSIPISANGSIAIYDIDNNGLNEIIYSGNDETIIYEWAGPGVEENVGFGMGN